MTIRSLRYGLLTAAIATTVCCLPISLVRRPNRAFMDLNRDDALVMAIIWTILAVVTQVGQTGFIRFVPMVMAAILSLIAASPTTTGDLTEHSKRGMRNTVDELYNKNFPAGSVVTVNNLLASVTLTVSAKNLTKRDLNPDGLELIAHGTTTVKSLGNKTFPVLLAQSNYARHVATTIVHKNALDLFEIMVASPSTFKSDITTVDWMSFVVADNDDSYVSPLVNDEQDMGDELASQIDGFLHPINMTSTV